jgi:hypothetical protein
MDTIELFIKEKSVNLSEMERELNLPSKSLRTDRTLPKKHLPVIIQYLKEKYGYGSVEITEVDKPEEKSVLQKVWNKNFIPNWHDGIVRYQDPENGLWKRLMAWQSHVVKETGEIKLNDEFLPASQEVFTDKLGRFYVAKNGIKVYKFDKN